MNKLDGFYSVIDYTVEDKETQEKLASAFVGIQKKWVSFYPGYLGARLLGSEDGKRLFNIVHWESEAAFRNFEQTSDTEGRVAAIQEALDGLNGKAVLRMSESPRYRVLHEVTSDLQDK